MEPDPTIPCFWLGRGSPLPPGKGRHEGMDEDVFTPHRALSQDLITCYPDSPFALKNADSDPWPFHDSEPLLKLFPFNALPSWHNLLSFQTLSSRSLPWPLQSGLGWVLPQCTNLPARAAITKCHSLGGTKHTEIYFLVTLGARSLQNPSGG